MENIFEKQRQENCVNAKFFLQVERNSLPKYKARPLGVEELAQRREEARIRHALRIQNQTQAGIIHLMFDCKCPRNCRVESSKISCFLLLTLEDQRSYEFLVEELFIQY